jgi:hypothetical protein
MNCKQYAYNVLLSGLMAALNHRFNTDFGYIDEFIIEKLENRESLIRISVVSAPRVNQSFKLYPVQYGAHYGYWQHFEFIDTFVETDDLLANLV